MKSSLVLLTAAQWVIGCQMATHYNNEPPRYDREGIRKTFVDHSAEIKSCYLEFLKINKSADLKKNGILSVDFDITETGRVARMETDKRSTLRNDHLEDCLHNKIVTWKFPGAPMGQTLNVVYPMSFKE